MRALFQMLLGIAFLSFTPPAGAVDGDGGSNVQVLVYEGPTECTDEDKILSGNYVSIHFEGYIDESSEVGNRGTRFISSRDVNDNKTVDFQIGKKRVIEGCKYQANIFSHMYWASKHQVRSFLEKKDY